MVGWLSAPGTSFLNTGVVPRRYGNAHPNIVPYQTFQARDKPFVVATGNDGQFRAVCRVIDRPESGGGPRFLINSQRVGQRALLVGMLAEVFITRDAAEWVDLLLAEGVPSGPINTLDEVFSDPQVLARDMLAEVEHPTLGRVRMPGIPFKLSATPPRVERHPPVLGEHTDEVLLEQLDLGADEIAALREAGAI